MHDVRSFSSQQFFRSAVALDPRRKASNGSAGNIRGVCHRDQLRTRASQNRMGMMLSMAAGTKERNAKRTPLRDRSVRLSHKLRLYREHKEHLPTLVEPNGIPTLKLSLFITFSGA